MLDGVGIAIKHRTHVKFINECYMFRSYTPSPDIKVHDLTHKYVRVEIFRNLRDLTSSTNFS